MPRRASPRCASGVAWALHSPSNDDPGLSREDTRMTTQKIAYITGGMGGIGTTMCQRLHKDGFKVIAGCGPSRDHAKWLGEQTALGYTFHASVGNVGD